MYFDFDEDLKKFTKAWIKAKAGKLNDKEIETAADTLYSEWNSTVIPALNKTPTQYFNGLADADILPMLDYYIKKGTLPDLLIETLTERKHLYSEVKEEVLKAITGEYTTTLMAILAAMNSADSGIFLTYLDWLTSSKIDSGLKEFALDLLLENVQNEKAVFNAVSDKLPDIIKNASEKDFEMLSDLAVYCKKSEEGYKLILDLFLTGGEDAQLYAAYLGMYGDIRAIPHLKAAAATCDFATFKEITNAVEQLGEELEITRNFENDPVYRKIKSKMDAKRSDYEKDYI